MKCNSTVLYGYGKKSKKKIGKVLFTYNIDRYNKEVIERAIKDLAKRYTIAAVNENCGGRIIGKLVTYFYDEGYEFEFKCEKCGQTYFEEIANLDWTKIVGELITERIEKL